MKTAYVSMLFNGDNYLPGVEALGQSIRASGSTQPLVLLVSADVTAATRARVRSLGWQLREVEPISNPTTPLFQRFANVFTKLRVWQLVEFDRVVLLDADTIVLQNVDDLFERKWFAAAPDFFLPDRFNSGVMVLDPSPETFDRMMASLKSAGTYDGGDQGFLNTFFANWYAMPVENRLPIGYNMANFIFQFMRGHTLLKQGLEKEVKIVHYMLQKPWKSTATVTGASETWWGMYFHAHPEQSHEWVNKVHEYEDLAFDKAVAMLLGG